MKWSTICTLIFIPMAIYSPTTQASIDREFARIVTLSEAEERMINTRPPYSDHDYLMFALIASGVPANQIANYKRAVDQIATPLAKAIEAKGETPEKRAEFILQWLHQNFFKKYSARQTRLDLLLANRTFNCVSSAVLYNVICRRFGIRMTGVIVPDHAFSQLRLPHKKIDIETTIRHGFDPTSKTKVFDEFGKLTGFVYVPQKNYRQRSEVGDKEMIALIYSNRYKALSDRRRHAEAARVQYVGWRLAGDLPRSPNTWANALGNYIIGLHRDKRYADALYAIDAAKRRFPALKQPLGVQRAVYTNWSYQTLSAKQYDAAIRILKRGLSIFPRDAKLLHNLKTAYVENAQALGKAGRFAEAHRLIEVARQKFPQEENLRKLEIDLTIREAEKLPADQATTLYQKALRKYPNNAMLLEAFAFLYIQPAQKLGKGGEYEAAVQLLVQGEKALPASRRIRQSQAITYNNWGLSLAKKKDFAQAKLVIERGLSVAPSDATLKNNWNYVLLEWADSEFKNGHFDSASKILLEGLEKTSSHQADFRQAVEAYYNESAIQLLKRGEIRKGIERLEAGLKIVLNSKVMKKNLKTARQQKK